MSALSNAKEAMATVRSLCNQIDNGALAPKNYGSKISMMEMVEDDILLYLLNIAPADGSLDVKEVNYINEVLGTNFKYNDVLAYLTDNIKTVQSFLDKTPKSMAVLVGFDSMFAQQGQKDFRYSAALLQIFGVIGGGLVKADNVETDNEKIAWGIVYQNMERCRNEGIAKYAK